MVKCSRVLSGVYSVTLDDERVGALYGTDVEAIPSQDERICEGHARPA